MFAIKITRQDQTDLVKAGSIEHTADKTQCPQTERRGRGMSRFLPEGGSRSWQSHKSADKHRHCQLHHRSAQNPLKLRERLKNVCHGIRHICELVVYLAVRNQPVFNTEHYIAKSTQSGTVIPVKLFAP